MRTKKKAKSMKRGIEQSPDLAGMCLRQRMELMAETARELIMNGGDCVFAGMAIKGSNGFFTGGEVVQQEDEIAFKNQVVGMAMETGADCVVAVHEAWMAPHGLRDRHPSLRASLHPERRQVIVVFGKDHFEHLVGVQDVHRHGDEVVFDDLNISASPESWLDAYPALNQAVACC
jgi:hypothetical protein